MLKLVFHKDLLFGPLVFLIFTNDIIVETKFNIWIFSFLFQLVDEPPISIVNFQQDLIKIYVWGNPDMTKQAVELIKAFLLKLSHPFNVQ